MVSKPIIPCELSGDVRDTIESFSEDLRKAAPTIGSHGLNESEFWDSGIFHSAIERLRGKQAASSEVKRRFVGVILDSMKKSNCIKGWNFTGSGERHDYEILLPDGHKSIIETKGCLDGNNTNIFERPPNADEFIIWSLCQNPGSDPRHNAWSGIHTRLSAETIHRKQRVDALIIWDMLCGTKGRPCPKLNDQPSRATKVNGKKVPPPCIYLFPRTIPDPRNNPNPLCWKLEEIKFIDALSRFFKCEVSDVFEVQIQARMKNADVQRKTTYIRGGEEIAASNWTTISRAR